MHVYSAVTCAAAFIVIKAAGAPAGIFLDLNVLWRNLKPAPVLDLLQTALL